MRKDEFSDHSFLRQRDLHGRWSYGIGEGCRLIDTGRQSLVRQNLTVVIYASRSNIALPGKGGCSVLIVVKGVACTKNRAVLHVLIFNISCEYISTRASIIYIWEAMDRYKNFTLWKIKPPPPHPSTNPLTMDNAIYNFAEAPNVNLD